MDFLAVFFFFNSVSRRSEYLAQSFLPFNSGLQLCLLSLIQYIACIILIDPCSTLDKNTSILKVIDQVQGLKSLPDMIQIANNRIRFFSTYSYCIFHIFHSTHLHLHLVLVLVFKVSSKYISYSVLTKLYLNKRRTQKRFQNQHFDVERLPFDIYAFDRQSSFIIKYQVDNFTLIERQYSPKVYEHGL